MVESSGSREYVAGLLAGLSTVLIGHPFDTVKVKLQNNNTESRGIRYRSGLHCTAIILKREGVRGLYRGAWSSFVGMAFESCLLFGIYSQTKQWLQEGYNNTSSSRSPPLLQAIVPSAALGGAIISCVLCPSELVKCRVQVQGACFSVPRPASTPAYTGTLHCAVNTIKHDGVSGIFRGGVTTLMRECIGNATFFTVYEYVRYYTRLMVPSSSSSTHATLLSDIGVGTLSGGLAGIAFWVAVLPLDLAKTKIQTCSSGSPMSRNPFSVLNSIYKRLGVRGLYTGLGPTLARAFPANAAAVVTWEMALKYLNVLF